MKKRLINVVVVLAMLMSTLSMLPVHAAEMKTANVSTAEELLAAIASDTKIILAPGVYNMGKEYLSMSHIENLEIYGNGQAEITTEAGHRRVISTYDSNNIIFSGFTVGHDVPKYGCGKDGNVFGIFRSNNIEINNCDMYGCGFYGIESEKSTIIVNDSTIRDCMSGITCEWNTGSNITFNNCSLLRNAYDDNEAINCAAFDGNRCNITLNNCNFVENHNTKFAADGINVVTNNCTFTNNAWDNNSSSASQSGENGSLSVKSVQGSLEIKFGGIPVMFIDAKPFIDDSNRTQIPVRALAEALGATVNWNGAAKVVTISNGLVTMTLTIGSDILNVNGSDTKMDTAAMIVNDRTYVPLRFIAEAMGMTVSWE